MKSILVITLIALISAAAGCASTSGRSNYGGSAPAANYYAYPTSTYYYDTPRDVGNDFHGGGGHR